MSTCSESRGPRTQRGDMLVEALVGRLLLCVLGVGMVYVATQVTGAQRDARVDTRVHRAGSAWRVEAEVAGVAAEGGPSQARAAVEAVF